MGVHLTFDDGPHPCCTSDIASLLKAKGYRATFFLLGENVRRYPHLVQRLHEAGHALGVHGHEHRSLALATKRRVEVELIRCLAEIKKAAPDARVRLFRPPYGRLGPAVLLVARKLGLEVVLWDRNPRDYACRTSEELIPRVLSRIAPGSIILLHDAPPGGPITRAALPRIVAQIEGIGLPILPL